MAPRERKDVTVEQDGAAEAEEAEVKEVVDSKSREPPWRIVWRNVVSMAILHSASLYALVLIPRSSPLTWLWCVFCFVFSALGITAGVHRLWSHRSYKASLPLRILLAVANSMAFQNDIFEWSRDHRVHHKYSETDADPHDARRGFFFSHMGWLLLRKRPEVIAGGKRLDLSDLYNDPVVVWQRSLVELVRWRNSNPPPTTQHQAPGTRNDATDTSQHGNGPDKTPAGKTRLPPLPSLTTGRTLSLTTARQLVLSFLSPRVEGKRFEVLTSRLDEGLSGDSWPPLIGRAHGGWREPHPCA